MKKLILCGMSCTGKTTAKKNLVDLGLKPGISYTTRQMREGEQEGVDYRFITRDEFIDLINDDFFFEHDDSLGECYGTSVEDFETCDVFILTPKGISQLTEKGLRDRCIIVKLDLPIAKRIKRASDRGDETGKILKRISLDHVLFSSFDDKGIITIESDGTEVEKIMEIIKE